jgi:multidrug transporter EmrE-like cation transporter
VAYLYLTLAFSLNSIANILLKLGAERGLSLSGGLFVIIQANWQLLLGLTIFASNIIFYFLALRALPLSVAYPVMVVMGFLIVNGYALLALHEPITTGQYMGYLLIVIGLTLVVARA